MTDSSKSSSSGQITKRLKLTCMNNVEPRLIDWLWQFWIAQGRITVLVGMPGAGKSYLTCCMAAKISTGRDWPDGSPCDPGSVIFITSEDDPHDTIRPRLDALGADPNRIHLLSGVIRIERGETSEMVFTLADIGLLEEHLQEHQDCKLIVIDPIGSYLGGGVDAYRDNDVRAALSPVANLAEKYGVAVLVVMHRRKSTSSFADDTAMGSRAFTAVARSVIHLCSDADDPERRLLLPGKSNLATKPKGLAFAISGDPATLHWEDAPIEMTADDALAREHAKDGKRDDAADFLRDLLADGEMPAKEVLAAGRDKGFGQKAMSSALARLGGTKKRDGFGPGGCWRWSLPAPIDGIGAPSEKEGINGIYEDSGGINGDVEDINAKFAEIDQLDNEPDDDIPY